MIPMYTKYIISQGIQVFQMEQTLPLWHHQVEGIAMRVRMRHRLVEMAEYTTTNGMRHT